MAAVARSLDSECARTIVAGAAGVAFLHLGHGPAAVSRTGEEQPVMAVAAGLEFEVLHMGEAGIMGKEHIPQGVAGAAIGGGSGGKSSFAVVARAARLPFAHLSHRIAFAPFSGGKDAIVAVTAAIHLTVGIMPESHGAGSPRFEVDLFGFHMATVTVAAHSEYRFIFMTDTAGKPLFHIGHGIAPTIHPAYEGAAVATAALQKSGMDSVAEEGIAFIERHILDGSVAAAAVTLDREGGTAVVTAAARLLRFHLQHCVALAVGTGHEQLVVAVSTNMAESQVGIMAESGIGREGNIPDRVALGAVPLYGEGSTAVMTGTTGNALLHLLHGDVGIVGPGAEEGIVAIGTTVCAKAKMKFMAENYGPEVGDIHRDFLRYVAAGTFGKGKSPLCVVTSSARLARLHFLHGDRRRLGADFEDCVVAERTVAAQGLQVYWVIEIHRSGGFGFEFYHLVILGEKKKWQT